LLVVGLRQDTLLIGQPAREIAARSPCALLASGKRGPGRSQASSSTAGSRNGDCFPADS
jgi:hypothetical protein